MNINKCNFDGFSIKPDGVHELDPCVYKQIEEHHHCVVRILKCKKCGHIEIEWEEEP